MKYVRALSLSLLMWVVVAQGAAPGEEYVRLYSLMQQGETLERTDRPAEALAAFLEAQEGLTRLQRSSPDWNPKVVDFRLRYVQAKIAQLTPSATVPSAGQAPASAESPTPIVAAAPTVDAEVEAMRQELRQLRSDNSTLQAKLKEALSVRPAAADPRELEKSEQRNLELTKEIEVLRLSLEDARGGATPAPDSAALQETRNALQQETQRADRLTAEVAALRASSEAAAALRSENALLKQQLESLRSEAQLQSDTDTQVRLDTVTAEFALLRSEAEVLRLEKSALEDRLQELKNRPAQSSAAEAAALADSRARVTGLEREREQLQIQLALANQKLAEHSQAGVGEPTGPAQVDIEQLKARLAVYEAEKVPYSVEELALFRMSRPLSPSELSQPMPPDGTGTLVAQAERQFKQGEFQQAESTLREILAADDSNAFTLANLAATQMEQGRDAEAEVNLRKALAIAPHDPFALATLGILKFRQHQYADALDYLGVAAQYNPKNAVIHNYLGMTLSEQGMRGPAETALRRAIQLQPDFSDAHFNLALVYILQDPPLPELARWHYQKALKVGHGRSPEMEQLLDKRAMN